MYATKYFAAVYNLQIMTIGTMIYQRKYIIVNYQLYTLVLKKKKVERKKEVQSS